jgi:hypothetical protein
MKQLVAIPSWPGSTGPSIIALMLMAGQAGP